MSIVVDILRTYRAPREVFARQVAGPRREDRLLAYLVAACALIFVAQWPRLSREAALDPAISLDARLAGALFAWAMIMPLFLYALAWGLSIVLRAVGVEVSGYHCRLAVFWALLATTPVWLFSGLLAGFAPGLAFSLTSALALLLVAVFAGTGIFAMTKNREAAP